ncbi:MAG: hypothetical protein VX438_00985 [Planctomycetota bacterium]|jgi:uncharacterized membrane protein|nr:hypothetical protein [Planctomycetota bacterium]
MNNQEKDIAEETPADSAKLSTENSSELEHRILLVPYPKIVFLYPTFIVSLLNAILLAFINSHADTGEISATAQVLSFVFLGVLFTNFLVIGFDFPRATSLSLFLAFVAVILGAFLLSVYKPGLLGSIGGFLASLKPFANSTFYWCFSGVLGFIYVAVVLSVRFDYWEVRHNELLHHHGVLSDLKRYAAPNLRVDKEINDVFEYFLLRSGRLILHPSNEKKAIVLDNVLFINSKEERLTRLLGEIKVVVRQ